MSANWTIKKIAILVLVVLTQVAIMIAGYQFWEENKQLKDLLSVKDTQLTQADLELGRANTKIADAQTLISSLDKKIQEEIKKRQATINMYADLEAKYTAAAKDLKLKTQMVIALQNQLTPKPIELKPGEGLFFCKKDKDCEEIKSIPFSFEDFRLKASGEILGKKFSYSLSQRFAAKLVETKLPNGLYNHYAELYELDDKGNKIGKLELTKFNVIRSSELKPRMSWFNPKIDLGVGYSLKVKDSIVNQAATGELGVSLSSRGLTKFDITWRFFRIALAISTTPSLSLIGTPAQFNAGRFIKPFSNLWISPSAGYDFNLKVPVFSLSITGVL